MNPEGYEHITPQLWLEAAQNAVNQEQWDRGAAYASIGLLSMAIGAFKAVANLQEEK